MTSVPLAGAPKTEPVRQRPAFETLRGLWPYMWPKDRADLKRRVVVALATLVAAKIITVLVPYTYKWATDGLVATAGTPASSATFRWVTDSRPSRPITRSVASRICSRRP